MWPAHEGWAGLCLFGPLSFLFVGLFQLVHFCMLFTETDLLEAELGSHPSQVWRAILEGRDALKLGLIRRIGDSKTIKV
jgi:hypothetical protein